MSQRNVTSQAVQQQFPDTNHLMPSGLNKVPSWFQTGPFRYNLRLFIGFLPGVLLVSTVAGKLMVAAILLGVIVTLYVRNMELRWMSMMISIGHIFVLEIVNVYCLIPLVWRSILNVPLFGLFHIFIALNGMWWWLQDDEFKKQDPRFVILLERVLFYMYPALSVTMVTWVCSMLFGKFVMPYVICVAGLTALSLYMTPLQSSFAKPQTPTDIGLVQHRFVAWLYMLLELSVPAVVYAALSYNRSLQSGLILGLFIVSPPFLLTLLEAQGLFYWTGLGLKPLQFIRWISGSLVLLFLSVLVYVSHPTSYLPLLLVPVLFAQLALVSYLDHSPTSLPTFILASVLGLLYSAAFTLLPWSISHNFSFISLPLSVVQLLLWGLALGAVAVATLLKKVTPQLWIIYNSLFVGCEYILSIDNVYPPYIAMVTGAIASIMYWRLHSIGQMPLNSCLLNICLHVTKLTLLLPSSPSPSPLTSTLLSTVAIFLMTYMILRVVLFEHSSSLTSSQLMVYTCLLLIGLLLSFDSILSPLWSTLTHRLPSTATLIATNTALLGIYLSHGLSLIGRRESTILNYLPSSFFVMSALFALLQPEFNISEISESFLITLTKSSSDISEEIYLAAWKNLLTWVTLYSAVWALVVLTTNYIPALTVASLSFFGMLSGFLAAIALLHFPPSTLLSMLYAAMLGLCGALLGRAYSTKKNGNTIDYILFAVLVVVFLLSYFLEWAALPQYYLPGKSLLEFYAMPCTKLFATITLSLAVAFRFKMQYQQLEQPYLPLLSNACCLIFFLLILFIPLHQQLEVSVVLSSCVFLLAQPDGFILPKTSSIFLAPSLLSSVVILYFISIGKIVPRLPTMIEQTPKLFVAARVTELVCLLGSMPGQVLFLYYLWTGKVLKLSAFYLILYILPNAFLPQFASSHASTVLGTIGIISFCLLMIGDYANIKII